jgi:hypothetical protein
VERGIAAREGEATRLVVDTARLHFFDLDTGESLTGESARELVVS